MKRSLILILCLLCINCTIKAQELSTPVIKETTFRVAQLIEDHYVLKDKGSEISNYLIEDFKKGTYSTVQTWKDLDSLMTESLNKISNDGHLYVWNNEKLAAQLAVQDSVRETDTPDDEAEGFFNDQNAIRNNFGFRQVQILRENIGYIKLTQINISEHSLETLYAAMELVKNTSALILDLRNNGGGGSTVGPVFESFFFKKETALLEFRTRDGESETKKTVPWLLEKRYTNPLYIIVNEKTASAAEAFAFSLKHTGRATIVGEASAGAAYMNTYFRINEHFVLSVSTAAPFLPDSNISWEQKGVQPDIVLKNMNEKKKILEVVLESIGKNSD